MHFFFIGTNKDNVDVFLTGGLFFGIIVCALIRGLYAKKTDILKTSIKEGKKKQDLEESSISQVKEEGFSASVPLKSERATHSRMDELNSLLRSTNREIAAKKKELSYMSPISGKDVKEDGYTRTEQELEALQQQRSEILFELINLRVTR